MWGNFSKALDEASRELYDTMSDILGQGGVLDLGEKDWYEELNALDPSRPRFEEDALMAAERAVEEGEDSSLVGGA